MTAKKRWPREVAVAVAKELVDALRQSCEKIAVAGSLRRGKAEVGDLELVLIGRTEIRPNPDDLFGSIEFNFAEVKIWALEQSGILGRRLNSLGSETFGPQNKLMYHVKTGLPVDLFSTTKEAWANCMVCRTGPAESNVRICQAAQRQGYKWNPTGVGFTNLETGEKIAMESEEAVFGFVGLPFLPPERR